MKSFVLLLLAVVLTTSCVYAHQNQEEQVGGLVCTACEEVIGYVEDWVDANKTLEEIEVLLDELCADLGGGIFTTVCEQIVATGVEEILQYLEDNFTPEEVCVELGLCDAARLDEHVEQVGGIVCTACEEVIGYVEDWIDANKTIEEIEVLLDELCADLGGGIFTTVCEQIVAYGVDEIYQYLEDNWTPEEVCVELSLCDAVQQPEQVGGIVCTACEEVIGYVEDWIDANKTLEEIEVLLDELCADLGGGIFTTVCEQIVAYGVDEIYQYLEDNWTPEEVCVELSLCDAVKQPEQVGGIVCTACEEVIGYVEDWIDANKTLEEIEVLLDELCADLGGGIFTTVCEQIVAYGVDEIYQYLEDNWTPEEICVELGLCDASPAGSLYTCTACQEIIGEIEDWLNVGNTIAEIEVLLEDLCADLGGGVFSTVCDEIVEFGVDTVVAYLQDNWSPAAICTELGLCYPEEQKVESVVVCKACEEIIGSIEDWIDANKTLEEIEVLLDQLCEDLGGGYVSTVCEQIVATGVEEIMAYLEDNFTPSEICTEIGLCDAAPKQEDDFDFWCASCHLVVSAVEYLVLNNNTIDEIETFLDQFCQILPDRMAAHCNAMINYDIDMIVKYIELNYGPEEICSLIGMCDKDEQQKVGDFWCESCYVVMTIIEDWIESNKTVTEIEELVDELCAILGDGFEEVCDAIVEIGVIKVIEWINVYENPTIVCQQLGLCDTVDVAHNFPPSY